MVLIVHQHGVRAFKGEGHAPVATHPHRKMPFRISFELMSKNIDILNIRWPSQEFDLPFRTIRQLDLFRHDERVFPLHREIVIGVVLHDA